MKSQARPRSRIGVKVTSLTTYGSDFDSNATARPGLALHIIVIWQQSTNPSHWILVSTFFNYQKYLVEMYDLSKMPKSTVAFSIVTFLLESIWSDISEIEGTALWVIIKHGLKLGTPCSENTSVCIKTVTTNFDCDVAKCPIETLHIHLFKEREKMLTV